MNSRSLKAGPIRWRFAPFVRFSIAAHAVAAGAFVCLPSVRPWALLGGVANHLLLVASGLWPRSSVLGPNWTRLPHSAAAGRVAITFDDGPDPDVTPRVLDILDRFRATASFFCIGERARRYPELVREIRRRGHAVENHSHRHTHRFSILGPRAMSREVAEAQEILSSITGEAPRFFRAPAGLRNALLEPILRHAGLHLTSWTRRGFDTVSRHPGVVSARLLRGLADGDILLLHDGDAARAANGQPIVLEVLPNVLAALAAAGLRTITLRNALLDAESVAMQHAPVAHGGNRST